MSHKGIWWLECPGSIPGINSGRPRNTRDVWADLCGNSLSRGRMFAGQTGQTTGQMGHVHGTDGTQTKGCPAKILYVYWLFFPDSSFCQTYGLQLGGLHENDKNQENNEDNSDSNKREGWVLDDRKSRKPRRKPGDPTQWHGLPKPRQV